MILLMNSEQFAWLQDDAFLSYGIVRSFLPFNYGKAATAFIG